MRHPNVLHKAMVFLASLLVLPTLPAVGAQSCLLRNDCDIPIPDTTPALHAVEETAGTAETLVGQAVTMAGEAQDGAETYVAETLASNPFPPAPDDSLATLLFPDRLLNETVPDALRQALAAGNLLTGTLANFTLNGTAGQADALHRYQSGLADGFTAGLRLGSALEDQTGHLAAGRKDPSGYALASTDADGMLRFEVVALRRGNGTGLPPLADPVAYEAMEQVRVRFQALADSTAPGHALLVNLTAGFGQAAASYRDLPCPTAFCRLTIEEVDGQGRTSPFILAKDALFARAFDIGTLAAARLAAPQADVLDDPAPAIVLDDDLATPVFVQRVQQVDKNLVEITPLNVVPAPNAAVLIRPDPARYNIQILTHGRAFTHWRLEVIGLPNQPMLEAGNDGDPFQYSQGTALGCDPACDAVGSANDDDDFIVVRIPRSHISFQGVAFGGGILVFHFLDENGYEHDAVYGLTPRAPLPPSVTVGMETAPVPPQANNNSDMMPTPVFFLG